MNNEQIARIEAIKVEVAALQKMESQATDAPWDFAYPIPGKGWVMQDTCCLNCRPEDAAIIAFGRNIFPLLLTWILAELLDLEGDGLLWTSEVEERLARIEEIINVTIEESS